MNAADLALLDAVCQACARLYARNLLAAADGNISVRLSDGRIAMTPSGVSKLNMGPRDLATLSLDGRVLSGFPSSERPMHLAIYQACPEARVIAHAHPPTAVAWTVARPHLEALPYDALPEVILGAGAIPIVPYARPGTEAMAQGLLPFLPEHRLLILARHGAVAWGEDLEEAIGGLERAEHVAQILASADALGGITGLPPEEVEALRGIRATLGPRLR